MRYQSDFQSLYSSATNSVVWLTKWGSPIGYFVLVVLHVTVLLADEHVTYWCWRRRGLRMLLHVSGHWHHPAGALRSCLKLNKIIIFTKCDG